MAVLHQMRSLGATSMQAQVAAELSPFFWGWYDAHSNDKILTVGLWFLRKTIRVRDVRMVFVLLFGEHP